MKKRYWQKRQEALYKILPESLEDYCSEAFEAVSACAGLLASVQSTFDFYKTGPALGSMTHILAEAVELSDITDRGFTRLKINRKEHERAFRYYRTAKKWLEVNNWNEVLYKIAFNVFYVLSHLVELSLSASKPNDEILEFVDLIRGKALNLVYSIFRYEKDLFR